MRPLLAALELLILLVCVVLPRCWNHEQVFVGDTVYFTDADCYSRMSRVRICWEHPGSIVRHHDFENFPSGVSPHTTAPLDYAIVFLALALKPFTTNPVDSAGAWISPLLGLAGGLYLWWWCRRLRFRYRWPALLLYAFSPILVHGTLLGRPDHQSLLILLVLVALGAELGGLVEGKSGWQVVAGVSWGFAFWVSVYEPLLLFGLTRLFVLFLRNRFRAPNRWSLGKRGWGFLAGVVVIAFALERRLPGLAALADPLARNWARSIGELHHVAFVSPIWWSWCSFLLVAGPALYFLQSRRNSTEAQFRSLVLTVGPLCLCTFGLTMWQARWAYFFVLIFVILLPALLELERRRWLVWALVLLCFWPVAKTWDETLWPNEATRLGQMADRQERIDLHALAIRMKSPIASSARTEAPFLAPWWLSPPLAYWSGQPGVAGSSHESLPGIEASAQFFSAIDVRTAEDILRAHRVAWVVVYDADRTAQSSSEILGSNLSPEALAYRLDRSAGTAPALLMLSGQTTTAKLFQVVNNL